MGYKQRTIRIGFDDLGDGCFVTIRNPRVMSSDELDPGFAVETDADGNPTDPDKARQAGIVVMSRLVTDWCVWDVNDDTDDPAVLPLPSEDDTVWDRVPVGIIGRIGKEIHEATTPH